MFKVFWLSIKDLFDELFLLIGVNFIWCLISLPLLVMSFLLLVQGATVPGFVLALVAVLPLGPATAGLYTVAQRVHEGRTAGVSLFFEGLRQHSRLSWQVYGAWMLGLITILINIRFYAQMASSLGLVLQVLFLYFLVIWFALLIYIGPLMLLQQDKRLRLIARNAFLMTLGRPVFTLITLVLMTIIGLLSLPLGVVVLPLLCLFSLLATWSFRATAKLIKDAEERRREAEEKAANGGQLSTEKGRGGQIRPRD